MHTNMHTLIQKKDSHLRLFYGRREPPLLVQSVVWPFEIILALFMFFNRFSPIATPSLSFGLVGANADILFHCAIAYCVIHPPFLSAKKVKRQEMSQTVKPYRLFRHNAKLHRTSVEHSLQYQGERRSLCHQQL